MSYKKYKKYYIVYQITNKVNNKIYIGVHGTNDKFDKYMGSGTKLKEDIEAYGLENFDKMILFEFDNPKDALKKEKELVNKEFIKKENTYNIIVGGGEFYTGGTITVRDKNNKCFNVNIEDPRYLLGELKPTFQDNFVVLDTLTGEKVKIKREIYKQNKDRYKHIFSIKTVYKDKEGNVYFLSKDEKRYINKELIGTTKNLIIVKNKEGEIFFIDKKDPRFLSGELLKGSIWDNRKHSANAKQKMCETHKKNNHQKREKNSQFGMIWIYNLELKESRKIKQKELENYLTLGWIKGRKIKF